MTIPDLSLEQSLWQKGYRHVVGVDEAGKGSWAGPVTAGAVIIHSSAQVVSSVRDSKLMNNRQRENAFEKICKKSSAFGIGIVSEEQIDLIGINTAVKKAMMIALQQIENALGESISYGIIDGSKTKPLELYTSRRIKKGGLYHYSISAGSILAKVTRDRLMKKLAKQYPQYGFEKHVGYGTKAHINALNKYGTCPLHRKSYAPIKKLLSPVIPA